MLWIVGYIAFVAYASGLFMYSASHGRHWAAIGILLSVTGFQFVVLETISSGFGITIALIGLGCVGRDLAATVGPRVVTALARPGRETASGIGWTLRRFAGHPPDVPTTRRRIRTVPRVRLRDTAPAGRSTPGYR